MKTHSHPGRLRRKKLAQTILIAAFLPAALVLIAAYLLFLAQTRSGAAGNAEIGIASKVETSKVTIDHQISEVVRVVKFISDIYPVAQLADPKYLQTIFESLDQEFINHIFEDLGVINARGFHMAYVGPYELLDKNYSQEPWFLEVMEQGFFISDIFLGFRRVPHFIVAVKRGSGDSAWVLRATVNGFLFSSILDNIRFGNTGEVFIVNKKGLLQTRSLANGTFMQPVNDELLRIRPHSGIELYRSSFREARLLIGQAWLVSKPDWLLVVQQDERDALAQVGAARNRLLLLLVGGLFLLSLSVLATIRLVLQHFMQLNIENTLMDEQMIQSQKLAAIGQLSAGIAHEINNPLAIIGEEAGWLQDILKRESMKDFKEAEEFKDSLREIVSQAGRCREITHKLLSFARKMDSAIRDVELNVLLDEVASMREKDASLQNIKLVREFEKDLPILHSEPSLLRQVFLNLINNAIDAIRGGGEIRLVTRKTPDRPDTVSVSIGDSGIGIPKENLDKIFDPFFTTKPPGKGTGLGLSICHGIVKKIGGEIAVTSVPGKGTTFSIILPLEPPKVDGARSKEVGDADLITTGQTPRSLLR